MLAVSAGLWQQVCLEVSCCPVFYRCLLWQSIDKLCFAMWSLYYLPLQTSYPFLLVQPSFPHLTYPYLTCLLSYIICRYLSCCYIPVIQVNIVNIYIAIVLIILHIISISIIRIYWDKEGLRLPLFLYSHPTMEIFIFFSLGIIQRIHRYELAPVPLACPCLVGVPILRISGIYFDSGFNFRCLYMSLLEFIYQVVSLLSPLKTIDQLTTLMIGSFRFV